MNRKVNFSMLMAIHLKVFAAGLIALFLSTHVSQAANGTFGGGDGSTLNPYIVQDAADLNAVRNKLSGHYKLGNNIDLSAYLASGGAGYTQWSTSGWMPIGNNMEPFRGSMDGNGYKVSGLWMFRKTTDYAGLFGFGQDANIKNIGVETHSDGIIANYGVGGLIGSANKTRIENCYVTGYVKGGATISNIAGGLIGSTYECNIVNCYTTCRVSGNSYVGGLIGENRFTPISYCYASGEITADNYVGGLIGYNDDSQLMHSYATGNVNVTYTAGGGLVGGNSGPISYCFASGNVSQTSVLTTGNYIGGLLGYNGAVSRPILNSYATGKVSLSGGGYAGGLIGDNTGDVRNCYATGNVNSSHGGTENYTGGLIGYHHYNNTFYVSNCYARGNVAAVNGYIGGLIGVNESVIKNCVAANDTLMTTSAPAANLNRIAGKNNGSNGSFARNYSLNTTRITVNNVVTTKSNDATVNGTAQPIAALRNFSFYTSEANWETVWDINPPYGAWKMCNGEDLPFMRWENRSCLSNPFSGGTGTAQDPYLICNAADLDNIRTNLSANYKLAYDIDLTAYLAPGGAGYAKWNTAGWMPVGTLATPFKGVIDGNGYKITGMWMSRPTTDNVGFVGYMSGTGAAIKKLGVEITIGRSLGGHDYVGGLVGTLITEAVVSDCYTAGNVTGTNGYVGGLAGLVSAATVNNCYTTGAISGINRIGGLAGGAAGADIKNCYATGNVSGYDYIGGLVGYNNAFSTISNCYAVGFVKGHDYVGGLLGSNQMSSVIQNCIANNERIESIGANINRIAGENSSSTFHNNYAYVYMELIVNGSPITASDNLTVSGTSKDMNLFYTYAFFNTGSNWYESTAWNIAPPNGVWKICDGVDLPFMRWEKRYCPNYEFSGGDGSTANPFILSTPEDLDFVRTNLTAHYKLKNNIDLSGYLAYGGAGFKKWGTAGWLPIGDSDYSGNNNIFKGSIDGGGYKITGLWNYRPNATYTGLFGQVSNAIIKNLGVETHPSYSITGNIGVGILAGNVRDTPVDNCYTKGSITGGPSGTSSGSTMGGLIGATYGTPIRNCYSNCNITTGGQTIGGLVGSNSGPSPITNSYATGNIIAGNYAGGLVGSNSSTECIITDCYATGDITGSSGSLGGLIGTSFAGIYKSYATGNVAQLSADYGYNNVGGLVGYTSNLAPISACFATGNVSANGKSYTGGLVGYNWCPIINCYATGNVTANQSDPDNRTGGLVGYNYCYAITNSYARGNVQGFNGYIGGLAGLNEEQGTWSPTTIKNCVAANNIVAATSASASINRIAGSTTGGGVVSGNYALSSMSVKVNGVQVTRNNDASLNGTAKPLTDFQQIAFYNTAANWETVWDINPPTGVWKICGDMPFLRWQKGAGCSTATITVKAGANGTITPGTNQTLNVGATQRFTFAGATGYEVDKLLIDGVNVPDSIAKGSYTFVNVQDDHSIEVSFKRKNCTITLKVDEGYQIYGTITPNTSVTLAPGSNQRFTFAPKEGCMVGYLLVDGVEVPDSIAKGSYTFVNVQTDHTIQINFSLKFYTITTIIEGQGYVYPDGETNTVNHGDNRQYYFAENVDMGYKVDKLLIDGVNVPDSIAGRTYTFVNVKADHTIKVVFTKNTGITDIKAGDIKVFPNPTTGLLTIENGEWRIENVEICDIFGKKLSTLNSQLSTHQMDISHLPSGIYFLKITTDKKVVTQKIIKQ